MKPTAKLRFIERDMTVPHPTMPNVAQIKSVRILQQWWEQTEWDAPGEWRDVPLEKDE